MIRIALVTCMLAFAAADSHSQADDFPRLTGPYLGQEPPGMTPELFAPGIVSRAGMQTKLNISPDSSEIVYAERDSTTNRWVFMRTTMTDRGWNRPAVIPFSEQYTNMEPSVSPDGIRLYFVSDRPLTDTGEPAKTPDIWYSEKIEGGWREPVNLGPPINGDGVEVQPFHGPDSHFYFCRPPAEILCVALSDSVVGVPVRLNDSVNQGRTSGPWVAPDGSYLLFHSRRDGGIGGWDLYVSFRESDSTWGAAFNLGEPINTPGDEADATISPDGKFIFLSRGGDIYWVSAKVVEQLRPKGSD